MNLPKARRDDLLTTNLDDEVVVYDPERKQAHSLNRVAVAVWSHSDGTKTIEELQRAASEEVGVPVDQGAVWLALSKLEKAHLLLGKVSTTGAMTRRDMLGKAGRYGAAALATPLIASALVPMAAAATSACSGIGAPCSTQFPGCLCALSNDPTPLHQCVNINGALGTCLSTAGCGPNEICILFDGGPAHCYPACTNVTCSC